jgi:hypothetical protein
VSRSCPPTPFLVRIAPSSPGPPSWRRSATCGAFAWPTPLARHTPR